MEQYIAIMDSPVGPVPFLGATMTPEREREVQTAAALRSMPTFGLEPVEANLVLYYQLVRKMLA